MGLFFSNGDKTSVVEWFQDFQEKDHARSGFVATEEVVCQQGPLSQFTHTMEPQLRKLGLPTALTKGVCYLIERLVFYCAVSTIASPPYDLADN